MANFLAPSFTRGLSAKLTGGVALKIRHQQIHNLTITEYPRLLPIRPQHRIIHRMRHPLRRRILPLMLSPDIGKISEYIVRQRRVNLSEQIRRRPIQRIRQIVIPHLKRRIFKQRVAAVYPR